MVRKMTKKEAVDKINNWEKQADGARGAKIGSGKTDMSLYDYAIGHGARSRSADRGGRRRVSGLGKFINPILNIFSGGIDKEITNQEFRLIRNAIRTGNQISDTSDNNPRNIRNSYNAAGKGEPVRREVQYGHWYSERYKQGQKNKGTPSKATYGKKEAWSSTSKGQAKPPLWQVFFAKRNEKYAGGGKVMSIGLFPLLEEIIEGLEGDHLELAIPMSSLQKEKTYQELVNIKSLRKELDQFLRMTNIYTRAKSTDKEGKEIDVVRIKPKEFQRFLEKKYTVDGTEGDSIKTLAGKKDAAGGVKEFSLPRLSATQIERLLLAAHGPDAKVRGVPIQWFNLWRSAPQTAKNRDLQKMHWRDYLQVAL